MKYMTFISSAENQGPPPQALIDAIGKSMQDAIAKGAMVLAGGLGSSSTGARVQLRGGKVTVIDGPFSESKEVIGGFAVFELATREEAVQVATEFMELHRKHWPGFEGVSEVRAIFG